MRAVGLVPARGGSRGIPRKNLALLGGKPLLAWTVEAALAAQALDSVVVSTEDSEIAAVARSLGADVLDRPASLARDDTPMLDVVVHAVDALGSPEVLVLLQPTSPFRVGRHVDQAVALLRDSGGDCVVSVCRVPHRYAPSSLMRLEGGRLVSLDPEPPTTRQAKETVFARNGPAVLVLRTEGLHERPALYDGDCRAYEMSARDSIDVDDPFDLELAELLLRGSAS